MGSKPWHCPSLLPSLAQWVAISSQIYTSVHESYCIPYPKLPHSNLFIPQAGETNTVGQEQPWALAIQQYGAESQPWPRGAHSLIKDGMLINDHTWNHLIMAIIHVVMEERRSRRSLQGQLRRTSPGKWHLSGCLSDESCKTKKGNVFQAKETP